MRNSGKWVRSRLNGKRTLMGECVRLGWTWADTIDPWKMGQPEVLIPL